MIEVKTTEEDQMSKEVSNKDLIIIGGGMAGLTAALYAGRMNLDVLVLENALVGGQIANATGIENYPGFLSVAGGDLIATVQEQAEKYGAVIDEFDEIVKVSLQDEVKIVETEEHIYKTPVVIIATGMERRKMPLADEPKYFGKGVHYCELCDGHMYKGKKIAVMGGGNAAVDAADFLSKYGEVYLVHRSELKADAISIDALKANDKVTIMTQTDIKGLEGEGKLEALDLFDKNANEKKVLPVDAVFVNIGVIPKTDLFKGQVELDESGRIIAGEDCRTNLPGVFAAGDVRVKEVRQLTTAAADGTAAALLAEKYIKALRKK